MRISFVVSLLFSGSMALVESAKNQPTSFREMLRLYPAQREEFLQRSKEQITQRVLSQVRAQADAKHPRDLQATSPTAAPLCLAEDMVNFENDDFQQFVFGPDFESVCTCEEDTNQNEIVTALQSLNASDPTAFAEGFNTLFGSLYSLSKYTCVNGCEACFEGSCGLMETTQDVYQSYSKTNFTFDQILNNQVDPTPFLANFTYIFMNCIDYTSGNISDGKLCFGLDFDTPPDTTSDQICTIEFDGVACNSCIVSVDAATGTDGCFLADCTNIESSAMIDSCSESGFVGPFVFFNLLNTENVTTSGLTLGSCDVASAPVATPSAPVGTTPAPVEGTPAPVTAPTAPVTTPTAPVTAPTAPVTAPTAPVKAPVKAPVAATPNAPTASGSSILVVSLNVLVFGLVTIATYLM